MNLSAQFKEFLFNQDNPPSKVTVKNYLSDLNKFLSWYRLKFGVEFEPSYATRSLIDLFKEESSADYSASSIDRKISSLRKFFYYLKLEGKISHSPFEADPKLASSLENSDPWRIKDFKSHLYVFNASHLTIKNYIIDLKQFIKWAEEVLPDQASWETSQSDIFSKIDSNVIEEYKKRLINQAHLSPVSVNRKLSSLRRYIAWANEEGLINSKIQVLNEAEMQDLSSIARAENKIPSDAAAAGLPGYSKFPPLRLLQKTKLGLVDLADGLVVEPVSRALNKSEQAFWVLKGKPVFGLGLKNRSRQKDFRALNPKTIPNIPKSFYAPAEVSTRYFPFYKKAWFHIINTRPKWYIRYHSYSFVSYLHFALLMLFISLLGYTLFSSFNPKNQSPTFAALPSAPPRILSFQGRLTDANNNPINKQTALRMAIYNNSSASGSALLWQEIVSPIPDSDGVFNVILGKNTAIPQSLFAQNSGLWLGVTVGQTPELTPRQQIATVAFASNAETLQGLPPITNSTTTSNVVLALNSSGNLTIGGTANPTFQATGGNFTVAGQTLILTTNTGSNGNVKISPSGTGTIDLQKALQNSSNNNSLIPGSVEVDDVFAIQATSSGQSAFNINQTSSGSLISASTSGTAKFTVDNGGNVTAAGTINGLTVSSGTVTSGTWHGSAIGATYGGTGQNSYTAGDLLFASDTTTLSKLGIGADGTCLTSDGSTPSWNTCATGGGGGSTTWFDQTNGALYPLNSTVDVLLGGQSTGSAKFGFVNINSGTPEIQINGTPVLNPTTLGSGVVNSSLTAVGTITSGVWNADPLTDAFVSDTLTASIFKGSGTTTDAVDLDTAEVAGTLSIAKGGTGSNTAPYVTNATDGTLTRSGSGPYTLGLNLSNANTWAALQTFGAGLTVSSGTSTFSGFTSNGGVLYTNGSGTLAQVTAGSSSQCLLGGTTPTFGSCATGFSTSPYWNQSSGALFANNSTVDLLIGGQSTAAAKFAVLGVNGTRGTQTASVSGSISLDSSTASVQSTNNLALTLGGNKTGTVNISPNNGSGQVNINGNIDASSHMSLGATGSFLSRSVLSIEETLNPVTDEHYHLVRSRAHSNAPFTGSTPPILWAGSFRAESENPSGVQDAFGGVEASFIANTQFGGTITTAQGLYAYSQNQGTGTITNNYGARIATADNTGGGTITNNYGLEVLAQTSGTNDYGIRVDAADTQTLWVSGNANNTTAAAGIAFGSSRDTNLYRSAANTLKTDDAFNVNGNANISTAGVISGLTGLTLASGAINLGGSNGTSAQCILGGATAAWGSCGSGSSGADTNWTQASGALYPNNSTVDFLIGGQSTTSAKFAVLNVNDALVPVASISATTASGGSGSGIILGGDGSIQSLRNGSLTLGGNTTGAVILQPNAGGRVGIGTTTPSTNLEVVGASGYNVRLNTTTSLAGDSVFININSRAQFGYNGTGALMGDGGATKPLLFQTASLDRMRIDTAGLIGLGTTAPASELHVTRSLSAGATGKSLAIFDQIENQDILTASKSGATKFVIDQNGNIGIGGLASSSNFINTSNFTLSTAGVAAGLTGITLASGAINLGGSDGTSAQCLLGGPTASWGSCGSAGSGTDTLWGQASGALFPNNSTVDFLVGGQSTTSAKFALTNINGARGTQTASISGSISLDSSTAGLQSTKNQTLTIGGTTTGDIALLPRNGAGFVGIGNSNPITRLDVGANGAANELIDVHSAGNAAIELLADTDNDGGEVGNPYIYYLQDNGTNTAIMGLTQVNNQDPKGNTLTGANANEFLIAATGVTGTTSVGIGIAGVIQWSVRNNGTIIHGAGVSTPLASLDLREVSGTIAVASVSGKTSFANLLVDQSGVGDIVSASRSGATRFTIANNGTTSVTINDNNGFFVCKSATGTGLLTLGKCSGSAAQSDLTETVVAPNTEAGDIVDVDSGQLQGGAYEVNKRQVYAKKSQNSYSTGLLGVVSTWGIQFDTERTRSVNDRPVSISGVVPVKVSLEGGIIRKGDPITSSSLPGVGMKATKPGYIVAKAAEDFDGTYGNRGKILALLNVSWYDPDVYLTNAGELSLIPKVDGNFEVQRDGRTVDRIGAFSDLIASGIKVGILNAQDLTTQTLTAASGSISNLTTNSLVVATDNISIAGQNIRDYIASIVDQRLSNSDLAIVSPLIQVDEISPKSGKTLAIKLKTTDETSKVEIKNASGAAVASINANGDASFSGKLSSNSLETNGSATVGGTLHAKKIIADEIEGLNIKATSVSANYITNNYYSSPSALSNPNLVNAQATGSAIFADLSAQTATFSQGLMSFGPTSFFEASVADRLFIGSQLSIANNSINVLGSDLQLQPLKQGGIAFAGGEVNIDRDGNLRVNGSAYFANSVEIQGILAANIIAPIPGHDLTFELPDATQSASQISVRTASGSALFSLTNKGDFNASGAGTFNKLNLSFVPQALAVSDTEVVATGSAGTAELKPGRTELTIDNPLVTGNSLIYITPKTSTPNQTIFLLRQVSGESFTVGISDAVNKKVPFNWIIIN